MAAALTAERLRSLAAAAVAAPSADNHHVVRLAAVRDSLRLLATPELASAARPRRILGLISAGAVAENLVLRARRIGLWLEPQWRLGSGDNALLAEFTCREAQPASDPLEQAIERRHTNRHLRYRGPPLSRESQQQLAADVAHIAGAALHWFDEPSRRRRALSLIRWAETERFRNRELHRELFSSIRFDVGWHACADRGLPPASLELPWFEQPAFALLRHWGVQRIANVVGTHRFIGWRAADLPCRLSPHVCAIAADGDIETAAVRAGRALQRVWLRATSLDVAVQVLAASALYSLAGLDDVVRANVTRRLLRGWRDLEVGATPMIVFRMGRAKSPSMQAGRIRAADLLVAGNCDHSSD